MDSQPQLLETLDASPEESLPVAVETSAKPSSLQTTGEIVWDEMADDAIIAITLEIAEQRRMTSEAYLALELKGKAVMERRLRARGDTKFATALLEKCELVDEYSEYMVDPKAAKEAADELRKRGEDEAAAKICKVYPAYTKPAEEIPERIEVGPQQSVNALIKSMGGDPILGPLLKKIRVRASLGAKFVWKERKL